MKLRRIVAAGILIFLAILPAAADDRPDLKTSKRRYAPRERVIIRLVNDTNESVRFGTPWRVRDIRRDQVVSRFHWEDKYRTLDPGESLTWRYDQSFNQFTSDGAQTHIGGYVGPGRYRVEVDVADYTLTRRFDIGRYFTLGFSGSDDTFIVFANERKAIRQMRSEAEKELGDKTLIVSGIVRGSRTYNPDWSFTMGPGSIILGEAFIETCDANPRYVEHHRDEWRGERWCPWSSYVKKQGR